MKMDDFGPPPPELIPFFQRSTLDSALQSLQLWERDRLHFGFGFVALGYRNGWWTVLVSKDLLDAALPF